jgi:hypothetical protein
VPPGTAYAGAICYPYRTAIAFVCVAIFRVLPASASDSIPPPTAETLFQQGRELLSSGRVAEACLAFEKSLALERGIGVLLNLGRCYELDNKPASAWHAYQSALEQAALSGDKEREQLASLRRDQVDQLTPRAMVILPLQTNIERIELDGKAVELATLSAPFRINPGDHKLGISQQVGVSRIEYVLHIPETKPDSERRVTNFIVVVPIPSSQLEAGTPGRPGSPLAEQRSWPTTLPTADDLEESKGKRNTTRPNSMLRAAAWIGVVVGTAAVGSGIGLGVDAISKADAADCDSNLECSQDGVATRAAAKEQLDIAYAVGIGGGVMVLASGIFLAVASRNGASQFHSHSQWNAHASVSGFTVAFTQTF